MKKVP